MTRLVYICLFVNLSVSMSEISSQFLAPVAERTGFVCPCHSPRKQILL